MSYFYDLVNFVDGAGAYENVLQALFNTPFEAKVAKDENRLKDCRYLREKFGWPTVNPGNCLEVLIVVARDMEDILYDDRHGNRTVEWFWLMMSNMGLTEYTNARYEDTAVLDIIDKFVQRKYKTNGEGGPFPLRRPPNNQRRADLFMLMNYYVNENFIYEYEDLEEFEDE